MLLSLLESSGIDGLDLHGVAQKSRDEPFSLAGFELYLD
jgi:hypothetical protein